MFEPLEGRSLLSVSIHLNTLTVTGTHDDDEIVLLSRGDQIVIRENGRTSRFTAPPVIVRINVLGRQGNDRIDARRLVSNMPRYANLKVYGGAGDDRVESFRVPDGASDLYGGPGNDRLRAWGGTWARLYGQAGNDLIVSLMPHDISGYGGYGADRIFGGSAGDWLYSGASDVIDDHAADFIDAGEGDDRVVYDTDSDVYIATEQVRPSVIPLENAFVKKFWVGLLTESSQWGASMSVVFGHAGNFITFGQAVREGNTIRLPVLTYGAGSRRLVAPPVSATTSLGELSSGVYTIEAVGDKGRIFAKQTITVT